jgi:hypothetical protein
VPSTTRRRRRSAFVAALVLALVVTTVRVSPPALAAASGACPGCTVQTGPGQYVGSLLIPPGSQPDPPSLRATAASCDGCVWTLEPACQSPGATGGVVCPGALRACPPPQLRLALLLQRPGQPAAVRVGTFCLAPGAARLRPSFEPRGFGIVNVPVVLAAGQLGSIGRPAFDLAGHRVVLAATGSWTWRFGDGTDLQTRRPGGPWPDVDVAHAYGRDGRYLVSVTTTWRGQFWVDGAGPFVVAGAPVTQTAQLVVPVRSAVAQLVTSRW